MENCTHEFKTMYSKLENFDDSKWFTLKDYLFVRKCILCNKIEHSYKSIPYFIEEVNYNDENVQEYIKEKKLILK